MAPPGPPAEPPPPRGASNTPPGGPRRHGHNQKPDKRLEPLESTADLIARIKAGDEAARNALFTRIHKPLHRFAHGRLPARARDLTDTEDLVQSTMIRALDHVDEFDPKHEGSFMAYLRTSVMNRIRDEARRVARRPEQAPLSDDLSTPQPSPLEMAVGQEALERYEAALEKLPEGTRQAVILRVEMGYTYSEIANAMRITSTDAARMIVTRAITKLAQLMRPPAGPGRLRE